MSLGGLVDVRILAYPGFLSGGVLSRFLQLSSPILIYHSTAAYQIPSTVLSMLRK